MRHRLCLRTAHLMCLGSFVIALWGCTAHTSPAGTPSRRTLAELLQSGDPGTPTAHPETPTDQDWQLWTTIKARWPEVEQMLAARQVLLTTPRKPPGHTQPKTYIFDIRHIALIESYAQEHQLDQKNVLYQALEEFFQQRGYAAK
jgi:predicted membrane metal-binding protein